MILLSMILPNLSTPSALTETPLQEPLRLAQGLLCVICSTHYAARDFAKKTIPPFLFEHFSDILL
jgi:hypothetical protein